MKDNRFIPVDKREPVDDYSGESSEEFDSELFIGGAEGEELELEKSAKKVTKDTLYIAS